MMNGAFQSFGGAGREITGSYYVTGFVHFNIAVTLHVLDQLTKLKKQLKYQLKDNQPLDDSETKNPA
ncbi:hypothetical protein [Alteromonas sp. C1M14]|uniref:hypothetical protein n=1 Tax=Alteromonas sp. C1M14 TaxID=2841567 RepID=UPI001C0A4E0A|nr:hypothetical protein [Alteromonas sp. C1M14]